MADYILNPYLNPVRLIRSDINIDYDNYFTFQDISLLDKEYQTGIKPVNYNPISIINKEIIFQLTLIKPISSFYFKIFRDGIDIGSPAVSIVTPTGWVSTERIYNISFTPTQEGEYYLYFNISNVGGVSGDTRIYISDTIIVTNILKNKKKLVEITWYDSKNRYGGVFNNGTDIIWKPRMYYNGQLKPAEPDDTSETFEDEESTIILQSAPKRVSTLIITDISNLYIDIIKQQSVCNNYYVNGIKWSASDFSVSETEKSDVVDISMKLTMQENDYYNVY